MKVAVSNIAWGRDDDEAVAMVLAAGGAQGIELAPTSVWEDVAAVSRAEIAAYRDGWRDRGLAVAALQALLYGRPDLTLFESDAQRSRTLEHLDRMIRLAADLGAGPLVFGSPKARRVEDRDRAWADAVGAEFFREVGVRAEAAGVVVCIEANPPEYGADWVTTVAEARDLVARVAHPGFGLHLDLGGMLLSGEDPVREIERSAGLVRHFHVSEPYLAPVGARPEHESVAAALRRGAYRGWVSIEMRRAPQGPAAAAVRAALDPVVGAYGPDA